MHPYFFPNSQYLPLLTIPLLIIMRVVVFFSGKATVIYPVCENNVYIISPKISNVLTPVIKERFAEKFPGENYVQMLSMFNSPFSISHRTHFHNPASVQLLGKIVVFFLQQHLIVQVNASHANTIIIHIFNSM